MKEHISLEEALESLGKAVQRVFGVDATGRGSKAWKMNSDFPDRLICPDCGAQFDCWHWESKQMHFCPACGKKRKEDKA